MMLSRALKGIIRTCVSHELISSKLKIDHSPKVRPVCLLHQLLHRNLYTTPPVTSENSSGDEEYRQMLDEQYLLPRAGHNIFVLHPDIKWGPGKKRLSSGELQLAEACGLVEALPQWRVAHKAIYSTKHVASRHLFGKGKFVEIQRQIRSNAAVTAVFVNIDMLSPAQLSTLQKAFKLPVYDRYTVVLQIFHVRAKTKEAKLQVALAEIPYIRSRLTGMHDGSLDQQRGGMQHVGGSGETFLQIRQRLLRESEIKLKKALVDMKMKRNELKKNRQKRELPTVAIVGYTNAGKTSLIRTLTQDQNVMPADMLFATLDVTAHAGILPNFMKVLYIDTVGFISDIPTDLIASFSATLQDMLDADVVVHVCDISNPDHSAQKHNVLTTLQSLNLPQSLKNSIIEVNNKIDLLPKSSYESEDGIYVSAETGEGIAALTHRIQTAVMNSTGRINKHLKIPMNGEHLSWLYKEAVVESAEPAEGDTEALIVKVVMTTAQYSKFKHRFAKLKKG